MLSLGRMIIVRRIDGILKESGAVGNGRVVLLW